MKTIKATTKRGQALLETARTYKGFSLADVYGRYSYAKGYAWGNCYDKFTAEHGEGFRICSANTFGFTVAWQTREGVRMETRDNSYLIAGGAL